MRKFVALFAVAALASCSGGEGIVNPNSPAGTYTLATVRGQPLPYTASEGPPKTVLTSDVLTLTTTGGWTEVGSYTQTQNSQTTIVPLNDGGSWVRSSSTSITLVRPNGSVAYAGSFTGLALQLQRNTGFSSGGGGPVFYVFGR